MDADVIVIGAGAAGLAAARSLAGRPLRVIVLEARDRVGGRVRSDPSVRTGVPAELGAEFIHGRAEETRALLREAGSAAIDTVDGSWTLADHGQLQRDESDFRAAARILEDAHRLAQDESVDLFLRRVERAGAKAETLRMARSFVEGFEAADPAIASARAIAHELRTGVDFASARPLGGYGPMFEHLHSACVAAGAQIHLSTPVRRIAWRRHGVAIEAKTPWGEARKINARAVIVTVPVGVLRHRGDETELVFEPELPGAKRGALAKIEMGHAARVVLWFRAAFWERIANGRYREAAFFRTPGHPFAAYWTQLPVHAEQIIAWAGGPKATAMGGASPAELVERALDGFGVMLGEPALARNEFEGGTSHDWGRDPFARGAYSYIVVGGGAARAELGAPVDDTLFFAGEATSTDGQGGTVNGALVTGMRAAEEAATALGLEV